MLKNIFALIFCSVFCSSAVAQVTMAGNFRQSCSSLGANYLKDMVNDADGNLYSVGIIENTDADILFRKTDPLGNEIWSKTILNSGPDQANLILMTDEQTLIIAGTHAEPACGNCAFVMKTDTSGNILWSKKYEMSGIKRIVKRATGGYFISTSIEPPASIFQVARLDSVGNVLWARNMASMSNKWTVVGIGETSDGGVLAGMMQNDSTLLVRSFNENGIPMMSNAYTINSAAFLKVSDLIVTRDDGFYAVGSIPVDAINEFSELCACTDPGQDLPPTFVMSPFTLHCDVAGNVIEARYFLLGNMDITYDSLTGQNNTDNYHLYPANLNSTRATSDHKFLTTGTVQTGQLGSGSGVIGGEDIIYMRENEAGFEWALFYGGPGDDAGEIIRVLEYDQIGISGLEDQENLLMKMPREPEENDTCVARSTSVHFYSGIASVTKNSTTYATTTGLNAISVVLSTQNAPLTCDLDCQSSCILPMTSFQSEVTGYEAEFTNLTGPAEGYNWNFGDGNISTDNSPAHIYSGCDDYVVELQAFDACGLVTRVDTIETFLAFTGDILPNDTVICLGADIVIQNTIPESFSFSWYENETLISQDTHLTHTTTVPGTQQYTLLFTDGVCMNTLSASIHIPDLNAISPSDTNICMGGLISAEDGSIISYLWSTMDTGSVISIDTSGMYSVTVEDENGCIGYDAVMVTAFQAFEVNLGNDTVICEGTTIELNSGYPDWMNEWSGGENTSAISISEAGMYSVLVTDPSTSCIAMHSLTIFDTSITLNVLGPDMEICEGENILLDAGTGYDFYEWNNGESAQMVTVSADGEHSVTVTDELGCQANESMWITTLSAPSIDLGNDTILCPGSTLFLEVWQPGLSFVWQDNSTNGEFLVTQAGTYSVLVTNADSCSFTDEIIVTYATPPVVDLGPDIDIGPGQTATLDAGHPGSTYQWSFGETTQSISVGSGLYSVTVTDVNGCQGSDEILVNLVIGLETARFDHVALVYPNPAKESIFIELNVTGKDEVTVDIISINGAIIQSYSLPAMRNGPAKTEIDIKELPAGLYIARITMGELTINKKVVKLE